MDTDTVLPPLHYRLPAVAPSVPKVRRRLLADLAERGVALGALADDVALVVSELVTNGLTDVDGAAVDVYARCVGGALVLEVWDERDGEPARGEQPAPADAIGGRGLGIVVELAAGYEWRRYGGYTRSVARFELPAVVVPVVAVAA